MKFNCDSNTLQKGINVVEKAVSPRSTLPVMENIFVELKDRALRLRGNDLEIGIEQIIPIEQVENEGSVLVKAKTISTIFSKIPGQKVDFSVDGSNKVVIKADTVDFDILGQSVEDYPVFPSIEEGIKVTFSASDLRALIKYTAIAVSFDETKQFLNGILIKKVGGTIYFVATDGYRLAKRSLDVDAAGEDFSAIAPYKAVSELNKILQQVEGDQQVELNVSPNQLSAKMKDFLLVSRVVQGQFPDYNQVLPKDCTEKYRLSRRSFVEALDRASIIASASNNVIRLTFEGKTLVVEANAAGLGDFREDLNIESISSSSTKRVAFNVRLILDAIKIMEGDELNISFRDELSPCLIESVGDDAYQYVIMPIRTSDYQAPSREEVEKVVNTAD